MQVLDFLLDLIFPRFCVGCGKLGKYFCDDCRKEIKFYLPTKRNKKFFALAHYDGIIRQAIHNIKYRGHFAIIKEIAPLFPKPPFIFDYLIPVPLSSQRLHDREFNQSLVLAQELGKKWQVPVLNYLKRTRDTKPQFNLPEKARFKNVHNAFVLISNFKFQISNSSVCLVDDVSTTGATLNECAKVLRQAGVKKVCAVCIAKG
jgi:ComF family protein